MSMSEITRSRLTRRRPPCSHDLVKRDTAATELRHRNSLILKQGRGSTWFRYVTPGRSWAIVLGITRDAHRPIRAQEILLALGAIASLSYGVVDIVSQIDWHQVGHLFLPPLQHYGPFTFGLISTLAAVHYHRKYFKEEGTRKPAILLRWSTIASVATIAIGSISVIGYLLFSIADDAATRIDATKTTLSATAGFGAAIALIISIRRQWHHEIAAQDASLDATEQRVTDLYSKAVELLGSSNSSTKLGGMYTL